MKLTDVSCAPDAEYEYLRQRIDALPEGSGYILDCEMPSGCSPGTTTLNFQRRGAGYAVFLNPRVAYSGPNRALSALCGEDGAAYGTWPELAAALRRLLTDAKTTGLAVINTRANSAPATPGAPSILPPSDLEASIYAELRKTVKGQDTALAVIAHEVAVFISKPESRRCLSFLLWGPSGVGKTETARAVADILSRYGPHRYTFVSTDLNQFSSPHSRERLIGAPPSYIGFDSPPVFAEVTKNDGRCVFLFDELDKSSDTTLDIFMSIMDTGKCQANKVLEDGSRDYDFSHAILFFTGNYSLGSPKRGQVGFSIANDVSDIRCAEDGVSVAYRAVETDAEEKMTLEQRIFAEGEAARKALIHLGLRPEVVNRFTAIVKYDPLTETGKLEILAKMAIEAGLEWHVKIGRIAPAFLESLRQIDAGDNIRACKTVIEGRLADCFARAAAENPDVRYTLDGTLARPILTAI